MADERSGETTEPETGEAAVPEARRRPSLMAAELHYGPLPHPDPYERYATIIPDGANRIMVMAEREQRHRHLMERWGMAAAFSLGLVFLIGGLVAILTGHDAAGTAIIVSVIGALAGAFIKSQGGRGRE
jgi:uncharacterized membrane protein